jgi:VWFA-related protein
MRWRLLGVCSLALYLGGAGNVTAQQTAQEVVTKEAIPTFSSRVNLVPVTVVVRDSQGRPVGNLTKDDFRVLDNGKPQIITRFAVERSDAPVVVEQEPTDPDAPANPAVPPPVLASRFVAFLFDDIHLTFGDLVYVRDAAARHIATSLQPADRVAIYTTSGRDMLEFTDDRGKLQEAISLLRPNPLTGAATAKCPDISLFMADLIINKDDPQALTVALAQYAACSGNPYVSAEEVKMLAQRALSEGAQETRMATRALQEIVRRLSGMPGQRIIVLSSSGFFVPMFEHSDITGIINKAIAAKVIVNSLDVRGVWTPPGFDASLPTSAGGAQVINAMVVYRQTEATIQGEVLGEIAEGTGGTWIHDNNDLKGSLERLATPPEFLYVLAYTPDNLKSDGKYHNLKVTLRNSKGLTLQARKGYFATRRESSPAEQARQDIEDAVFSRDVVKDIPADLRTQFFKSSDDAARVSVLTRLDVKGLQFRKAEDLNLDTLTIVTVLFDTGGNYIAGTRKDVEMSLKDTTLANFLKPGSPGLTVRTSLDARPGAYVLRLVVRDGESHLMASENAIVNIP